MNHKLRNLIICLFIAATTASAAFAAVAPAEEGSSLLVILFVGFFALIIVLQLVPACLLFVGLLKGLLFHEPKSKEKSLTSK